MKNLKSLLTATGLSLATILGTSCTSDIYGNGPSTQRGSVTGGITGAALGAIVGNQSGRPLEGAAIGGLMEPQPVQRLEMLKIRKMDMLHQRDIIDLLLPSFVIIINIIPISLGPQEDTSLQYVRDQFISTIETNNFKISIWGQHLWQDRPLLELLVL